MSDEDKTYKGLERDANRVPIMTGNGVETSDGDGMHFASPHAFLATGNIFYLDIPERAVEVVIWADAAVNVSEEDDLAAYYTVPANTIHAFGVARTDRLYLDANADAGNLYFYFVIV